MPAQVVAPDPRIAHALRLQATAGNHAVAGMLQRVARPFPEVAVQEAKLDDVAARLRKQAGDEFETSKTVPKGMPVKFKTLHIEVVKAAGEPEPENDGVGAASFKAGSPPKIIVNVRGKDSYDQLNPKELRSFWDHVLYELQNARYETAIRAEKTVDDPLEFGAGRAAREAYSTVFHMKSLATVLKDAKDPVAFANSLGVQARRTILLGDLPGTPKELERSFTTTAHRANAKPGTRFALPSAGVYAYEWFIDQLEGRVSGRIIKDCFPDEEPWFRHVDSLSEPIDSKLSQLWTPVLEKPWKKPKLVHDVLQWTKSDIADKHNVIPGRIAGPVAQNYKKRFPSEDVAAQGFVDWCKSNHVAEKLDRVMPKQLREVAEQEFAMDTDPTVGEAPAEVTLQAADIVRFLERVDRMAEIKHPEAAAKSAAQPEAAAELRESLER